jgi:hypothetical protein
MATEAVKNGFADKILDVRPFPKNFDEGMNEVQAVWGHNHFTAVEDKPKKKKKKPAKKARKAKK